MSWVSRQSLYSFGYFFLNVFSSVVQLIINYFIIFKSLNPFIERVRLVANSGKSVTSNFWKNYSRAEVDYIEKATKWNGGPGLPPPQQGPARGGKPATFCLSRKIAWDGAFLQPRSNLFYQKLLKTTLVFRVSPNRRTKNIQWLKFWYGIPSSLCISELIHWYSKIESLELISPVLIEK